MKALALTVLIAFISLAALGFVAMGGHGSNCIAATLRGSDCPDTLTGTLFHIETIEQFALALVTAFVLAAITFFALSIFPLPVVRALRLYPLSKSFSRQPRKLLSWLTLFENSPNY